MPVTVQRERRLPTVLVEETARSMGESPAGSEQTARMDSEADQMNRTRYREPEEEQAAEQEQASEPDQEPGAGLPEDYYEILQISRSAELETIHRVYRIMALRFHPDNAKTGNLERFLLLKRAYQVLSDPQQRAAYDAAHRRSDTQPLPHFESKDFVYGVEGEVNRRLGILSLLYHKRRMGEGTAGMSVLDLESRMAFPREYLNFTLWYLRSKHYIMLQENSDYALTAEGVDYVEANSMSNRVIRQLLTSGCEDDDRLSDERPGDGAARFNAVPKPSSSDSAAA
jgi:curved DNA-binding protein